MKRNTAEIWGQLGYCGSIQVFLGFALAKDLYQFSFSDVLNEDTGVGYQRPFDKRHSLDFKKYIKQPSSSTIPLTFNLRKDLSHLWTIEEKSQGAVLTLNLDAPSMARVDCQHRLGELADENVMLAFMAFVGLGLREEMAQFFVINSKARGLTSSLTDYHESNLITNLVADAPHLYITRKLNDDPESPWYKVIRLGGETTSGLKRKTSFRMMQSTVSRFLHKVEECKLGSVDEIYQIILSYWRAVHTTFETEWENHRGHLITKGIGLYSLMEVLTELVLLNPEQNFSEQFFTAHLKKIVGRVDWSSDGTFSSIGGAKGAHSAFKFISKEMGL